jgi:hypothetical protein
VSALETQGLTRRFGESVAVDAHVDAGLAAPGPYLIEAVL